MASNEQPELSDGDVDHLVIAPCGVLAVETKYRFAQSDKHRLTQQRHRDLDSARRAARKVSSLLRSKTIGYDGAVTSVLVVWGPGSPDLSEGFRLVDDVYILDGQYSQLWSHLFRAPLLSADKRAWLQDALAAYQRKQHDYTDARTESLRRNCWTEFREGVTESPTLARRPVKSDAARCNVVTDTRPHRSVRSWQNRCLR